MARMRRPREPEPDKVTIRWMDPRVWQDFRIASLRRGMMMGELLTIVLRDWLARNEPPPPAPGPDIPPRERG
jgi:hypothetical protein